MIKFIGFVFLLAATFYAQPTSVTIIEGPKSKEVHAYLEDLASKGFSGSILVEKGGEVILKSGYGYANREKQIPFTPDTVSTIGSITKPLTATAILKLESENKLLLDDPISKYMSGLENELQSITIEQLLTHTSGLKSILVNDDFKVISKTDFIKRLNKKGLKFEPGARVSYSNIGYSVLAYIIESVSGKTYEEYVKQSLFDPLQMTSSGYKNRSWKPEEIAVGYKGSKAMGTVAGRLSKMNGNYWNLIGNGGIHMDINDMYRFYRSMKSTKNEKPDSDVIDKETLTRLFRPYRKCGPKSVTCFQGYAWVVLYTSGGKDLVAVTHSGGNGILYADFWWYPKEDIFIGMLTNNSKYPAEDVLKKVRTMLRK